jgi:hypothetical protein
MDFIKKKACVIQPLPWKSLMYETPIAGKPGMTRLSGCCQLNRTVPDYSTEKSAGA